MTTKRILVWAPRMPEFDREGGSRRTFHLIETLLAAGWAVTFVGEDATGGERYARLLRQMGVVTWAGAESRWACDDYLADPLRLIAAGHFDVALLTFWNIAEAYTLPIRSLSPRTRVIVDSVDLHFLRRARGRFGWEADDRSGGVLDDAYGRELARELNAYAAADGVLTVSRKEAEIINDFVADPVLAHAVPDLEDVPPSPVPPDERRGMVFLGNFRHNPNVAAVEFLCREILPRLNPATLTDHPVSIVGNDLGPEVAALGRGLPGVRPVGWVPSPVPYLHRTRLSLIPLPYGAGTKRKLIQALLSGTPSVSTTIGAEGLGLRAEEHLLVADDPAAFAAAIERLLGDAALWGRLADAGRAHIAALHGRDAIAARFLAVLDAILAHPPRRSAGGGASRSIGPPGAAGG